MSAADASVGRNGRARVLAAAVLLGLVLGFVKGDATGIRAAVGNLSAPWLLIGMYAGFAARRPGRAAVAGTAATGIALVAFYAALTFVLAGHLGGGGPLREFATELRANRVYFLFGAGAGPLAGLAGWWLRRRPRWMLVAAGAVLAGELAVVAAVQGRQLLPRPIYFSWAVDDWRPYLVECVCGVLVAAAGAWRVVVENRCSARKTVRPSA